jgi:hypothetical protein
MRMLLMLFALALTPALCKADVVWQNGRYVYVQPAYQPAYSRDYSQPSNRTDYALGINRYSPYLRLLQLRLHQSELSQLPVGIQPRTSTPRMQIAGVVSSGREEARFRRDLFPL